MADYYTQTVIHQEIPKCLIAPFERLLLAEIFENDELSDSFYYYASERPNDFITLDRREFEDAISQSRVRSRLRSPLVEALLKSDAEKDFFDFDLTSGPDYTTILQDIVRRSKGELPYVTIATAYTCSKMRPDGFGGGAIIITPYCIRCRSTYDVFERFESRRAKKRPQPRAAPP
jgi:hypothetical protein